LPMRFLWMNTR